ncbi:MAG: L,D-transpeptidase [Candidatus Ozemobacteraceae bacterium]
MERLIKQVFVCFFVALVVFSGPLFAQNDDEPVATGPISISGIRLNPVTPPFGSLETKSYHLSFCSSENGEFVPVAPNFRQRSENIDLVLADLIRRLVAEERAQGRTVEDTSIEAVSQSEFSGLFPEAVKNHFGKSTEGLFGFRLKLERDAAAQKVDNAMIVVDLSLDQTDPDTVTILFPSISLPQMDFAVVPREIQSQDIPDAVTVAQEAFLKAYRAYSQSVLKNGQWSEASKGLYKDFQTTYASYKTLVDASPLIQKIISGDVAVSQVIIRKSDFTSTVYVDGKVARIFPIAYGRNPDGLDKKAVGDCRTPEGNFSISTKQVNPEYKGIPGGAPENPLGTRWMGISSEWGGIGTHGTNTPTSIGTRASHGCVRMFTKDAEIMYKLVRVGTKISIKSVASKE